MSHNTLDNYFKTTFAMIKKNGFNLSDIENMVVFERDVYVALILKDNEQ